MEKNKTELFNHSGCLSREAILAWKEERLSVAEKYLVEHHLQECLLCREALEGLSERTSSEIRNNFADMNYAMQQRLLKTKKGLTAKFKLSVAAAIFLTLIGVFTLFNIIPDREATIQRSTGDLKKTVPVISRNATAEPGIQGSDKEETKINKQEQQKVVVAENLNEKLSVQDEPAAVPLSSGDSSTDNVEPILAMRNEENKEIPAEAGIAQKNSSFSMQGVRYKKAAVGYQGSSETTYFVVDEPPKFSGGDLDDFKKYIEERLNDPAFSRQVSKGRMLLNFTVDTNGVIKDIVVVQSLNARTDSLAVSALKNSPAWQPARQKGKPVNINLALPLEVK